MKTCYSFIYLVFDTFCLKIYIKNIWNNVAIVIIQNVLIYLDQNVSMVFVNNIYIGKYYNSLGHEKLI